MAWLLPPKLLWMGCPSLEGRGSHPGSPRHSLPSCPGLSSPRHTGPPQAGALHDAPSQVLSLSPVHTFGQQLPPPFLIESQVYPSARFSSACRVTSQTPGLDVGARHDSAIPVLAEDRTSDAAQAPETEEETPEAPWEVLPALKGGRLMRGCVIFWCHCGGVCTWGHLVTVSKYQEGHRESRQRCITGLGPELPTPKLLFCDTIFCDLNNSS